MIEVSSHLGERLLRDWGVESWLGSDECKYYLWGSCCIFSVIEYNNAVQVHMAMRSDLRFKCRNASKAFIESFGGKLIIAPILSGRNSLVNMVKKIGFTLYHEDYKNGNETVNIYVRYPDGFTN